MLGTEKRRQPHPGRVEKEIECATPFGVDAGMICNQTDTETSQWSEALSDQLIDTAAHAACLWDEFFVYRLLGRFG